MKLLKGQLISKADQRTIDSPKKRTDEFDLFAVKSKKANKTNSSIRFLGESMARQSAFEINWPLEEKKEYSVELKRTWVPSILVFCANFNHFESLDLITEHMACRLQTQMVPRFVIVSNSIEKSDFQKDLSSIVISMYEYFNLK